MIRSTAFSILLLFGFLPCSALDPAKALTQYGHDLWTADDGLPVTSVEVVAQTPDGYLWVGTEDGLVRFDGLRFTPFNRRVTPGLTNHNIRALEPRRAGGLWVGTWRGLFVLEGDRAWRVTVVPEDPFAVIESLAEDGRGTLWVGTQGYGVVRLGGGAPVRYTMREGLPGKTVWALADDGEGGLWIGSKGGLTRLRGGRIESFMGRPGLFQGTVSCFARAADGSWWMGGPSGLSHYQNGVFRSLTKADGLLYPMVDALAVDRDGSLWIGSRGGLSRLAHGELSHYLAKDVAKGDGGGDGLADQVVKALLADREGNLWIGTEVGGLERFRDGKLTVFGRPEGVSDDRIITIVEDRGAVWLGTRRGLSRLQGSAVTSWTAKDGLGSSTVTALAADRRGTLWVGTNAGVHLLEEGRLHDWPHESRLYQAYVSSFYEDPDGAMWVATEEGLARVADGKERWFTEADGMSCLELTDLAGSRDGGFWIGTDGGGLMRYRDGAFTVYGPQQGLSEVQVSALSEDADGALWIGAGDGGLNRFKDGRFAVITSREGLYDDNVFSILDDGLGALWMSTNRGVFKVAKAELNEVAEGRRKRVTPAVFGISDGMRSAECMTGASRGADGRLWFPTMKGAVAIDPRRLPVNRVAPPVRIEEVRIDGIRAGVRAGVRLTPANRRLAIDYTAPTFLAPQRVRFRVRLEGFDADWVDMGGARTATYTNLPPGRYRFQVIAANADGVWSPEGAALAVTQVPAFYQTAGFYGLAAGLAGLAAWGIYRLRVRTMRARLRAVLGERTRIARELHDTLTQDLVAASLHLEAVEDDLQRAPEPVRETTRRSIDRSQGLVKSALDAARRSVAALRAPVLRESGLPAALHQLAENVSETLPVAVTAETADLPEPLPSGVEDHLFAIAREAVSNAVRHAHARRIRVELSNREGGVHLGVADDGQGFEVGSQGRSGDDHFGLLGMEERARAIGGRLSLRSAPGRGTEVTVVVPLRGGSKAA